MMRAQQAVAAGGAQGYLPPGTFRPDLLGARHDHDLLHGDAVRGRDHELRGAAAARHSRCRLPDAQLCQLLADRLGRAADQPLVGGRRVLKTGWCGLSAAERTAISRPASASTTICGHCKSPVIGTLLAGINFVTTILKMRAPGMGYMRMPVFCWTALATNLLIVAAFPVLTATLRDAAARSLSRLPFLHDRRRRQHDDVRQPVLGLGTPGGLHPGPAGVRHLFRGHRDVLRQAAVRLPLDGGRDHGDLRPLLPRLAAPLLHHGRQRKCQRLLRRHDA